MNLELIDSIRAYKTQDEVMGDCQGEPDNLTPKEAVAYLLENPRNALVVVNFTDRLGDRDTDTQVAVFRGASDRPDNFYVQILPLEDPNDADGGDWTAEEALVEALDTITS